MGWALVGAIGGSALVLLGIGMVWIGGIRRVTEEQRAEAVRVKREMEALIASPGWKKLQEYAEKQKIERSNSVLLSPTETPMTQEFMKGEIQGISLFVKIPEILITSSKDILAAYDKERGDVRDVD